MRTHLVARTRALRHVREQLLFSNLSGGPLCPFCFLCLGLHLRENKGIQHGTIYRLSSQVVVLGFESRGQSSERFISKLHLPAGFRPTTKATRAILITLLESIPGSGSWLRRQLHNL